MDDYMPALPPGFKQPSQSPTDVEDGTRAISSSDSEEVKRVGPIGPALPPGLRISKSDTEDSSSSSSDSDDEETESKASRQSSSATGSASFIGPHIPGTQVHTKTDVPVASENVRPEEDEDVIGPVPHRGPKLEVSATEEFENRAQRMRDKLLNKDKEQAPVREEWMMSLPEKMKKSIGVEAKSSFSRSRCTGEIDNTWTESPAEREKREQDEREGKRRDTKRKHEEFIPSTRDQEMQSHVTEHNKKHKREKSLLEMHQKKLDKKKKKEKKKEKKKRKKMEKEGKKYKVERIPFDRERDLQTNHFDDAMKRSVLKKARGLGGRFETSGSSNKFL